MLYIVTIIKNRGIADGRGKDRKNELKLFFLLFLIGKTINRYNHVDDQWSKMKLINGQTKYTLKL